MNVEEFVMIENPFYRGDIADNDLLSILDVLYLDPMERELIRKRFKNTKKYPKLYFKPELIHDYILFYDENKHRPFQIEILGVDNTIVNNIIESFKMVLLDYDFIDYNPSVQGRYVKGIYGISYSELGANGFQNTTEFINARGWIGDIRGDANLLLEYIGDKKEGGISYIACVIYDRFHEMHGYAVLKF